MRERARLDGQALADKIDPLMHVAADAVRHSPTADVELPSATPQHAARSSQ